MTVLLSSSPTHFQPSFYSLATRHPMWTTADSSPYKVKQATVQAKMLSGQNRTGKLQRHWSDNSEGYCLLPSCNQKLEDLQHILLECNSHIEARERVWRMWREHPSFPLLEHILTEYTWNNDHNHIQLPQCYPLSSHWYKIREKQF